MGNLGGYSRGIFVELKEGETVTIPKNESWFVRTRNISIFDSNNPSGAKGDELRDGRQYLFGDNTMFKKGIQSDKSFLCGVAFEKNSNRKVRYSGSKTLKILSGEKLNTGNQLVRIHSTNKIALNGREIPFSYHEPLIVGDNMSISSGRDIVLYCHFFDVID